MLTVADAGKKLEQAKKAQEERYSVVVDGNVHHLGKRIATKKETITLKKCQQIVQTVQHNFGISINKIEIMMTQWDYDGISADDYLGVLCGDRGVPTKGPKKTAYYFPKSHTLQIWEDGMPVYENANGVISRDADALADCLL